MMMIKKNTIILNIPLFKYILVALFIATFFSSCNNAIHLNDTDLTTCFSAMIVFSTLNDYKIDYFRSFGNNKNFSR